MGDHKANVYLEGKLQVRVIRSGGPVKRALNKVRRKRAVDLGHVGEFIDINKVMRG